MEQDRIGIAVNVTRTRVTILVFNLTIISLMLSILNQDHGLADGRLITAHLTTITALFVGFCLTIIGLFWLLYSQNWDAEGLSNYRSFTFGSITTYLALSQTITAFMHQYLQVFESIKPAVINSALVAVPDAIFDKPAFIILLIMGGGIWFLITYFSPLMSAIKSSVHGGRRWVFVGYYFVLQIPIYWVYARAWHLQHVPADQSMSMLKLFVLQFIQPLLWLQR